LNLLECGVLPRLLPLEHEASAAWLARTLSRVLPHHSGLQAGLSVWDAEARRGHPEAALSVYQDGPTVALDIGVLYRALEARSPPLAQGLFQALHGGLLAPCFGPRETLWHFQCTHWNGSTARGALERYRRELEGENLPPGNLDTLVAEFERTLVNEADLARESPPALTHMQSATALSLAALKSWCNPLFSDEDALKLHTRQTLELLQALRPALEALDAHSRADRSEAGFYLLWQFGEDAPLGWEALFEHDEAYGGEVCDLVELPLTPARSFEKSLAALRLALGLQHELIHHLERYAPDSDHAPKDPPEPAPFAHEDNMPWTEPPSETGTEAHPEKAAEPSLPNLPQALRELRAEVQAAHEISLEALQAWWFPPPTSRKEHRAASARVCELLDLLRIPIQAGETVDYAARLPPM